MGLLWFQSDGAFSSVQAAAYRGLLSEAPHLVVGDHSGSGKTLAYLAPLVQLLRQEEQAAGSAVSSSNCPRLVVVVPTEGAPLTLAHAPKSFLYAACCCRRPGYAASYSTGPPKVVSASD